MVALLESIKLFLYTGKCVFIFGLDRKVVVEAINKKYQKMENFDGERYLEKIFEFSFQLPEPTENQFLEIYKKQYKTVTDIITEKFHLGDTKELFYIFKVSDFNNPRVFKRVLNKLLFVAQSCPDALKPEYLIWIFIFEKWKDFRKTIFSLNEGDRLAFFRYFLKNCAFPEDGPLVSFINNHPLKATIDYLTKSTDFPPNTDKSAYMEECLCKINKILQEVGL